jgi:uncharacterized small protein (DUF1192 family)
VSSKEDCEMFDDEPAAPKRREIVLGEDLYEFSVSDIDERVAQLESEIARLKEERTKKQDNRSQAENFFKT